MNTLQAGDTVPNFSAVDQDGNTIKLSDYKGKKLVVFFYPAANTPTCTVEACNLSDHYKDLQKAGYEILGVSKDTQRKQKNFKEKYNFPYPLLADTEKEVINAFGV
ncbi:MAG: peroxiredoxin, partial [Altibacter sp.]